MTIFGTFFRHYTNIFHKTIDQTIIVSCLMYLNLNWIKSQGVKYKLFQNQLFSNLKIYLINSHFMTIFGNLLKNYTYIFHKTEDQMVIFGCLVCVNLNWIKNYNKMLDKMKKKSYYCIISGLFHQSEF